MQIYRFVRIILLMLLSFLLIFGLIGIEIKWPGLLFKIADLVLEIVYELHKLIVYLAVGLVVIAEGIIILIIIAKTVLEKLKTHQEVTQLKRKLMYSLVWSMIFVILGITNLCVFDALVGPRLITLEIRSPKEMSDISEEVTPVSIFARNIKPPVYITVETPQGALWTQDKLFPRQFKENLKGKARLGEGKVGEGQTFKIFAVATKEDLKIGPLVTIPPDSIHSNTVNVRRIR